MNTEEILVTSSVDGIYKLRRKLKRGTWRECKKKCRLCRNVICMTKAVGLQSIIHKKKRYGKVKLILRANSLR